MSSTKCSSMLLLAFIIITVKCNSVNHPSIKDSFRQCLVSQPSVTLGHCLGVGAISKLQSLDSHQEFDLIDGFTLSRDGQEYREASYNFAERDPSDFRTLIDSVSHVFSQRTMHWDMGFVYPGLGMRVSPSVAPAGVLEFVLDPHKEAINKNSFNEIGTGKLLARQFLVPFLLGFKFNFATIVPILFGILALIAKKAVIISKIALVVSSAMALGTLLLGNSNRFSQQTNHHQHSPSLNPGFGGSTFGGNNFVNRFPEHDYVDDHYRGVPENNVDQLTLYSSLQKSFTKEGKAPKGRNFAWNEDEKAKTV